MFWYVRMYWSIDLRKGKILNNFMSCPRGHAPAKLWDQALSVVGPSSSGASSLWADLFSGSNCLWGRVLQILLCRGLHSVSKRKSTQNIHISRSLMYLQYIFIAYNIINCFSNTIWNSSLASAITRDVRAWRKSWIVPLGSTSFDLKCWFGKSHGITGFVDISWFNALLKRWIALWRLDMPKIENL